MEAKGRSSSSPAWPVPPSLPLEAAKHPSPLWSPQEVSTAAPPPRSKGGRSGTKGRPGSDLGDACMTDSGKGRRQAFVVWLQYFCTTDHSPDKVNPLRPASVMHLSNKYSLRTCFMSGAAGNTAVNWSVYAHGQRVFLIRRSVSLLRGWSPQASCWETCHSHRHGLCARREGG